MSRRDVVVGGVGRWAAPVWLRDPAARGRALVVLVALPVLAALGAATALLPPLLVGAGVAGVLLFLLVLLNVRLALLLYVATAVNLAAIPLPVDLPFAVTPDIVLTLVLTVAVLVQFAVRPQALAALPVTRLYLAFLALTLITMPLSPELLVGFKVWVRYVSYLVIAAAILAEIRQSRDVRLFFIAFVGSALVPMAVGLYQFLTITGEVISLPNFQQVVRLKATTGGSFTYAFYLTLVVAMALPVVHVKRLSRRYRLLLLAVLGAAVASLLLTYIRGAWLALAVALLILGMLRLRYLLIAAPGGIAALVLLADFVRRRLASSLSATDTGFERLHLWRQAWDHFLDSPVVGKGVYALEGRIPGALSPLFGDSVISPHNEYLQLLADTGLLGTLLFYGVVALALREAWWLWRVSRQPLHGALGLGFIAVVVVVVVGGLTANPLTTQPAVALYFWVLLALVAGARRCESATAAPAGSRLVDGLKDRGDRV